MVEKLLTLLEEYYESEYTDIRKKAIVDFLEEEGMKDYMWLYKTIIKNYSNTYKTLPDLARIKDILDKDLKDKGLQRYGPGYKDQDGTIYDKNMLHIGHESDGIFYPLLTKDIVKKMEADGKKRITMQQYIEYKEGKDENR